MGTIKDRNGKVLTKAEKIKKGDKNTEKNCVQKNCTKKIVMTQITTMVWSLTQSQTSWSMKSSGPEEALLPIKLVEVTGFQQSYLKS